MQWFHRIVAVLFAISAGLQWNDPDPVPWVVLYGAAAVLAWLASRGQAGVAPVVILGIVVAAWMALLADSMVAFIARGDWSLLVAGMKAGEPLIEESREFLGLMLVLAWCVAALLLRRERKPPTPVRA